VGTRPGGSRRNPATQNGSLTGEHPAGRVLVVDDHRVNRMLLTRSLEREGHRVRCAEDGLGALEVLRRDPCDVVLLDIVMPELDGVSVLERIKSDPALQDVPVIMISGVDETESALRCKKRLHELSESVYEASSPDSCPSSRRGRLGAN
jgi:CheY-like chemotaxis protein